MAGMTAVQVLKIKSMLHEKQLPFLRSTKNKRPQNLITGMYIVIRCNKADSRKRCFFQSMVQDSELQFWIEGIL